MRRLRLFLFYFFCFLLAIIGIFLFLSLSLKPTVPSPRFPSSNDFVLSSQLAKDSLGKIQRAAPDFTLEMNTQQLSSLLSLGQAQFAPLRMATTLHQDRADLALSYPLLGGKIWANIYVSVPAGTALQIEQLKLGAMPIPDALAMRVLSHATETYLHLPLASLNAYLDQLQITQSHMTLEARKPTLLQGRLSQTLSTFMRLGGEDSALVASEIDAWVRYYEQLSHRPEAHSANHSLAYYLNPMLNRLASPQNNDENALSALLGLALLADEGHLEHFIPARQAPIPDIPITLDTRRDLAKHFILSAALEALATSGISAGLGQAKEVLDSARGGSGFSFRDLAADRAGTRFAGYVQALSEGKTQKPATELKENDFFPETKDLAEGLSKQKFTAQYQTTESADYQAIIAKIDERIARTRLFSMP